MIAKIDRNIAVKIEKIDYKLDGIAIVEDNIIKIPFTNIGDEILIKNINYNKAIPIVVDFEIIKKSLNTQSPSCKYYGQCGGCKGQHLLAEDYINLKLNNLVMSLNKAKIINTWGEINFAHYINAPLNQRRRVFFSVDNKNIGFKKYRSNQVIEVNQCPLATININNILVQIKLINSNYYKLWQLVEIAVVDVNGLLDVTFISKQALNREIIESLQSLIANDLVARIFWQKQHDDFCNPVAIKEEIYLDFDKYKVKYSPKGFLQATSFGENKIVEKILSNNFDNQKILDLFCGFGGYSLRILSKYDVKKIESIDITTEAIKAINHAKAGDNKLKALVQNIMLEPLDSKYLDNFDTIIMNPPRVGARAQALAIKDCTKIKNIILVYCSVSSLVRDLAIILQNDFFVIASIDIIDQFIFSEHMEIVVVINNKMQ